jgi:O-methyltransferase
MNIRNAIHKSLRTFGLDLVRYKDHSDEFPPDFREDEIALIREVRSWTLTTPERIYALIQAVRYISANGIPGAIVECGVWKGGSMAAIARTLVSTGDVERHLYLFDTFEGMSAPTCEDIEYSGKGAAELIAADPAKLCIASLDTVQTVMRDTGYPADRMHFVRGKVEETIPGSAPEVISLLRLDTDWYESTSHELIHLYPRLSRNGVLLIDDYGHWQGARRACDEYFRNQATPVLLNRIDYAGRIAVKR